MQNFKALFFCKLTRFQIILRSSTNELFLQIKVFCKIYIPACINASDSQFQKLFLGLNLIPTIFFFMWFFFKCFFFQVTCENQNDLKKWLQTLTWQSHFFRALQKSLLSEGMEVEGWELVNDVWTQRRSAIAMPDNVPALVDSCIWNSKKWHNWELILEARKIDAITIRCALESLDSQLSNALRTKSISPIAVSVSRFKVS